MRVLVVGQGAREHAIIHALHLSPAVGQIHVAPGSDGMQRLAICHPHILDNDIDGQVQLAIQLRVDLVIVGPERPLVLGLTDRLREKGIAVFGPSKEAAQLEGSKVYAKEFLQEHFVPTARSHVVTTVEETLAAAEEYEAPWVLKADGLAAGKGVTINHTLKELKNSAERLFEKRELGEAGSKALLEEYMPGYELSYLILTNGKSYQSLPVAQDHKRLSDGDRGPNTGGMGAIAPIALAPALESEIRTKIMSPIMAGLQIKQLAYRGVLYVGLMVTPQGVRVVEFNCRFGDPETQVQLPLLDGDWAKVFLEIANGGLPSELRWRPLHSACVVLASRGYPEAPAKGDEIVGDSLRSTPSAYFLHAGTRLESGVWKTAGGRVISCVGLGSSREESLVHAYELARQLSWNGMQYRKDIGLLEH
jgi:phosphoribosylamine--glycine ligase